MPRHPVSWLVLLLTLVTISPCSAQRDDFQSNRRHRELTRQRVEDRRHDFGRRHDRDRRDRHSGDPAQDLAQSVVSLVTALEDLKHGNRIQVANRAGAPIRLCLHYLPRKAAWQTVGWWILEPGEVSFLAQQDRVLRTRNTVLYWYAEDLDGSRVWNGELPQVFEGRALKLREYRRSPDQDGVIRLPIRP